MKFTKFLALAAVTAGFSGASMAQELPSIKVLTVDVAQTIAHEAMMACRANGYKVTVTVNGERPVSRTFQSKADAERFADQERSRLLKKNDKPT